MKVAIMESLFVMVSLIFQNQYTSDLNNITYIQMAPKPAPKLTKKQLDELKKEEIRKREAEEKQRKEEEEERMKEKMRLDAIQLEKRAEEERLRIALERQNYRETLLQQLKEEEKALAQLNSEEQWRQITTEHYKSYDTKQTNISTFLNVLRDEPYSKPQKTLKECEEAEIYIQHIYEKKLRLRSENNSEADRACKEKIELMRRIEMEKINQIMIEMANSAEDMEEKNNQLTKKGEPNRKTDGQKILEYQHYQSQNFKIGMFLNSSTTKNLNKFRPIEIKEFGLNTEIPSKWMNANTIVKFQWVNFNPFSPERHQKFLLIGGVYNLEFYELLLGSKRISNIILKKHYKGREILEKFKMPTAIIKEPFNVMYQIPKYVFLSSFDQTNMRFAQYDFSQSRWVLLPPDTVVEYDSKDKRTICRIHRPEPIAYVQGRCTDYPYVAWELRTVEPGRALLDIQLRRTMLKKNQGEEQRLMVCFQIAENTVRLIMNEHYPELADLCDKPRSPQLMLYELSNRGINLLPIDEDYQDAGIPQKDAEAERNAIHDIAYALQSFYIRSEVNDSTEIVVKIKENSEYESVFLEDQEKDWKKIRWAGPDRCWLASKHNYERHLNLEILLSSHDICEKECVERMKFDKSYLFKRNVMKMLSLTRVLSFTVNQHEKSTLRWILKEKIIVK